MSVLFPILALGALTLLWLNSARAREFATVLARRYCQQRDLQFLDETVSLARIGVRWTADGLRLRRMYRFDFSQEGAGRHTGYLLMIGLRLEAVDDGLARDRHDAPSDDHGAGGGPGNHGDPEQASDKADASNVIPFRRKSPPSE